MDNNEVAQRISDSFEDFRNEIEVILRIEENLKEFGGFYQFLSALKKYGIQGHFDIVAFESHLVDGVNDTISLYLMFSAIAPYKGLYDDCIPYMTECLESFLARAKLDYASWKESGERCDPPFFITQAVAICRDTLGSNALVKIDPDYLTVKDLSILWNMTEEAIRNDVLSKPEIKSQLKKFGQLIGVPGELAFELSKQRQGFKASRIQLLDNPSVRLVPVDSNGESFSKACCNSKGYRIGRKGQEETIPDYEAALQKLVEMDPKPYWRRKNKNGNWGIVAGVSWTTEPIE